MSSCVMKFLSQNCLISNLGAQKRGKVWEAISQRLNAIDQPKFRVSARPVRHRYSLLTAKQAQKLRDEEKASGIHVEISELDS